MSLLKLTDRILLSATLLLITTFSYASSPVIDNDACEQSIHLGDKVSSDWSTSCRILSSNGGNNDPYAEKDSLYAKYYSFTLDKKTDVLITTPQNSSESILANVYDGRNFDKTIISNKSGWWSSHAKEKLFVQLEAGNYTIEITQYNRVASGQFTFTLEELTKSCNTHIELAGSIVKVNGYLSKECLSEYRGKTPSNDPYGEQLGDHYSKRYEFTLKKATKLRFSASTDTYQHGYLYLSKKDSFENILITQSHAKTSRYYGHSTLTPQFSKELGAGTYVLEYTSYTPKQSYLFYVSIAPVKKVCDLHLDINQSKPGKIRPYGCKSKFKESKKNPDPYGYPRNFKYLAKRYTFTIDKAGTYQLNSQSDFDAHLFLVRGGDHTGELIDNYVTAYSSPYKADIALQPGIYTLEYTTVSHEKSGYFSVLIWDKKSPLEDLCSEELDILRNNNISSSIRQDCKTQEKNTYYKRYEFSLPDTKEKRTLEAKLGNIKGFFDMSLLKYLNGQWKELEKVHGYGYLERISKSIEPGKYRLEISSYNIGSSLRSYTLTTALHSDRDNDGVYDSEDAFPDNPLESRDTDKDGIGDNADQDDDNDGIADVVDNDPEKASDSSSINNFYVIKQSSTESNKVVVSIKTSNGEAIDGMYYYTLDDTALANVDYEPVIKNFSGSNQLNITVPIKNNGKSREEKSFFLVIFDNNIHKQHARYTRIAIPAKGSPSRIVAEKDVVIANENESYADITINRTGNTDSQASVLYQTYDYSAHAGQDYSPVSGRIYFNPGEISHKITVPLIQDTESESDEVFFIKLSDLTKSSHIEEKSIRVIIKGDKKVSESTFKIDSSNLDSVNRKNLWQHTITVSRSGKTDFEAKVNMLISTKGYTTRKVIEFKKGQTLGYIPLKGIGINAISPAVSKLEFSILDTTPASLTSNKSITWHLSPFLNRRNERIVFTNGTSEKTIPENSDSNLTFMRIFKSDAIHDYKLSSYSSGLKDQHQPIKDFRLFKNRDQLFSNITIQPVDDNSFEGYDLQTLDLTINKRKDRFYVYIIDREDIATSGYLSFDSNVLDVKENNTSHDVIIQRLHGNSGKLNARISTRDGTAKSGENYVALNNRPVIFENGSTLKRLPVKIINDSRKTERLYFYVDMIEELGGNKKRTVTLKVNIEDNGESSEETPKKGLLGLGMLNTAWLIVLALPLLFIRVRVIKKQ